jgi:hypothetical protein
MTFNLSSSIRGTNSRTDIRFSVESSTDLLHRSFGANWTTRSVCWSGRPAGWRRFQQNSQHGGDGGVFAIGAGAAGTVINAGIDQYQRDEIYCQLPRCPMALEPRKEGLLTAIRDQAKAALPR